MSTLVMAYLAASLVFAGVLLLGNRFGSSPVPSAPDTAATNQRLAEIEKKVHAGELSDEDASQARLTIINGLIGYGSGGGPIIPFRRTTLVAATALSLATSIAVAQYAEGLPAATSWYTSAGVVAQSEASGDEVLSRLRDYAAGTATKLPSRVEGPMSRPGETAPSDLPDVDTMITRLASRLEKEPNDGAGWRMLGWSYFRTDRLEDAKAAYEKALALEPDSAEIKASYDEVKSKLAAVTAGSSMSPDSAASAPSPPVPAIAGNAGIAAGGTMSEAERDAMVRGMVDRLASRLEQAPHDAEGWKRLIRSRTVLGEKDAAAAAFKKALEIFKDEPEQATEIAALASELGVTSE